MAALVDKLRMPCLPHVGAHYLYSLDICFNKTFVLCISDIYLSFHALLFFGCPSPLISQESSVTCDEFTPLIVRRLSLNSSHAVRRPPHQ